MSLWCRTSTYNPSSIAASNTNRQSMFLQINSYQAYSITRTCARLCSTTTTTISAPISTPISTSSAATSMLPGWIRSLGPSWCSGCSWWSWSLGRFRSLGRNGTLTSSSTTMCSTIAPSFTVWFTLAPHTTTRIRMWSTMSVNLLND